MQSHRFSRRTAAGTGRRPIKAGLGLILLGLAACSRSGAPEVSEARIQLPPPGATVAVGYLRVRNPGETALQLRVLDSPAFGSVEMHETLTTEGVSRMRRLESLEVPAHGEARLEPGGAHLMLFDAKQDLSASEALPLRLQFTAANGTVTALDVPFSLAAAGSSGEGAAHHH